MQHIRFLSVFLLALMTTGMQAAKVSLKMNTTARTMNRIAASVQKPSGSTYSLLFFSSIF
jgi:hypothetical protein